MSEAAVWTLESVESRDVVRLHLKLAGAGYPTRGRTGGAVVWGGERKHVLCRKALEALGGTVSRWALSD